MTLLPCQPAPHNPAERQQTFPTPPRRERWLEKLDEKRNIVIPNQQVKMLKIQYEYLFEDILRYFWISLQSFYISLWQIYVFLQLICIFLWSFHVSFQLLCISFRLLPSLCGHFSHCLHPLLVVFCLFCSYFQSFCGHFASLWLFSACLWPFCCLFNVILHLFLVFAHPAVVVQCLFKVVLCISVALLFLFVVILHRFQSLHVYLSMLNMVSLDYIQCTLSFGVS